MKAEINAIIKIVMELREFNFLILCLAVCGSVTHAKPPQKVIQGLAASSGEFPYQVYLKKLSGFCGGSIIDANHILTAAHCVVSDSFEIARPKSLLVYTGIADLQDPGFNTFRVSDVFVHPLYDPTLDRSLHFFADIAVLKLTTYIIFGPLQKPISLPSANPADGVLALASGWGAVYYNGARLDNAISLQKLKMVTMSLSECDRFHRGKVGNGQICARAALGSAMCYGDSGGPLVYNDELIGVVSWTTPCAKGYPDIFTNVHYYLKWIHWALSQ